MTGGEKAGRIALCYGTRPQVIKASAVRRALAARHQVLAVDTGQHYDFALNELLYQQLGVAPPDCFLGTGSGSHATQTAAVMVRCEALLTEQRPQAVVVIGDTNSTLGSALAAAKLRIPVVHVEAGLAAADYLMAEELNRRATDAIARVLCTPSARATARMRAAHADATVVETGDVALDVLQAQLDRLPAVTHLRPPDGRPYVYATLHRAELTDDVALLRNVLATLSTLEHSVILAMHPRTRAALEASGPAVESNGGLTVVPAVGYLESLALAHGATAVVTDSGGVQREAYWLGVPCVTLRRETEWEETLELGANRLLAPDQAPDLLQARLADAVAAAPWDRSAYGRGDAATRIAQAATLLAGEGNG